MSAPTVRDVAAAGPAMLIRKTRPLASIFGAVVRMAPVLFVTFLLLVFVPAARACSLDGIASLSVNGNVASINANQATTSTFRYWAPFTLLAVAPGDTLHFSENLSNVRLSIPKESASLPFRWSFGDGTTAIGQSVTHRYARTGWYRLTVQYYWPSHRQWLEFDSAEQHVVPQGDLLRTNLGFYAGKVFLVVLRVVIWTVLLGTITLIVIDRVRPGAWRRLRRAGPTQSSGDSGEDR